MKKILLFILLGSIHSVSKSQAVLNEIYFNPASDEKEYIEIYNSGAFESLNCYTLFIKYNTGSSSGFYVINFPAISLNSNTFSVGAASLPFNYQAGSYTGGASDFSWNALNSAGSNGYFKQFEKTGATYTEVIPPVNTNDILQTLPSGDGAKYITLLFRNGILVNGLIINGGSTPPVGLTGMPDLAVPSDGAGCSGFTAVFSSITANQLEYMTPAIGSSNGAFRQSDGKCGSWDKASRRADNTPGSTNGPSSTVTSGIALGGSVNCTVNADNTRTAQYFVVNATTTASSYPLVLQLYLDDGSNGGQLDAADTFMDQQFLSTAPAAGDPNTNFYKNIPPNENILVVAKSTAGCFQTILAVSNTCSPLPVLLRSFSAARNSINVELTWVTSAEVGNRGFNVQRNLRGTWENLGFVPSSAKDGNSSSDLFYSYSDVNNASGISQYRIQQVDIDGRSRYSQIRSVRGQEMSGRMLVFPNPSFDGSVQIVFADRAVKEVQLLDMSGRIIRKLKNVTNSASIIGLSGGMYSLQVKDLSSASVSVEKVIIKKR